MHHQLDIRVFYEDTDMAGIVYYANYLRFIERARSTMMREAGLSQLQMRDEQNLVFAVQKVNATYHKSAKIDDLLTIETNVQQSSPVRMIFVQRVKRGAELIFSADVTVICMDLQGRPKRLPAEFCAKMGDFAP